MKKWKKENVRTHLEFTALVLVTTMTEIISPTLVFASDPRTWVTKATSTLSPMTLGMALIGFLVVGMAHSSIFAAEWAQRHEKAAFKGAIISAGAAGLCNIVKSIVG